MVAEIFVAKIAEKVLKELESQVSEEACLLWGVKSERERLKDRLSTVKAVLFDAEKKQVHNQELTVWLGKLKEVFLDAQDVLDEFECEELRSQVVEIQGSIAMKVRHFLSCSNPLLFRINMGHKIKEIRTRLDDIAADKAKFHLSELAENMHVVREREMTHSFVHPLEVIGREHDKENIVKHLMNVVDGQNVLVIPIVGIGGLGKTLLAKLVFNDARVVEHFELQFWVCVSDYFILKQLLVKILRSIPDESCNENWNDLDEEHLQNHLRNVLDGRKFLLVLDDVWNTDRNKWIELRNLLMGGANGSKILVTTRSPGVAYMMGTMSPYNLKGLPHEECMSLFVKWAFEDREESTQHANLVKIGDEIVQKCKGVPLAVKSLGSLLYSKLDEKDWKFVGDNEIWKLERKEGDILSVLQLSYNLMPSYLKECFAYCSLYPKDYIFISMDLIQLWMAHDSIQKSPNENRELEDIGNQYIDELYSRSFLEDYYDFGSFRVFKIHDLMHDLALSVQSECLVINSHTKYISKEVRHLSILDKTWQNEKVLKCLQRQKSIRTIYCPIKGFGPFSESFVDTYISRFRYLRVLDLSDSCFEELPKSIGTMKHLRRLELSRNRRITKLRNSICKLQNLQCLLLDECEKLEELPKNMRYMISLRWLEITTKQKSLPESLNSLQFLEISHCRNMEYLSEVKQGYMGLRMLHIENCEGLISLFPFLKCLTLLEALGIHNCKKLDLTKLEDNQEEFTPSIRVLVISRLPLLVAVPQWFKQSTRTLQHMIIRDCPSLTELPEWLPNLASLKLLQIGGCPKLSSLPEGKLFMPTLRFFKIWECPELSRRCQPEIGEDWHKIARVSTIEIDDKLIKQADN
ncbi:hypothetical protein ACJW30_06G021700 [Castanea mollissima]